MDIKKYLPAVNKAILATYSFWGYYFVRYLIYGILSVFYENEDTEFLGYPETYYTLCVVFSVILLLPYCIDSISCDIYAKREYMKNSAEKESFIFGKELLQMCTDLGFIVYNALSLIWYAAVLDWYFGVLALVFNVFGELFLRLNWFAEQQVSEYIKPQKGNPFFKLTFHLLLWYGAAVVIAALSVAFRELFSSVNQVFKDFFTVAFFAVLCLLLLLFLYRRLRAFRIQSRLFKKLDKVCRENSVRYKRPKGIYSALFRQKVMHFTLEHKHIRFNCVLVPTLLRKTPLYFLGNGRIKRVHTFYFFKIDLFSSEKSLEYSLPKPQKGEKNIIILSPIPREFFIGAPGNAAAGDFNSEVDKALIYSGSEFCNYVERILSEKHIYKKEDNA